MKWYFIKNPSNNQEKTYTFFIWIRKKVLEKKNAEKTQGELKYKVSVNLYVKTLILPEKQFNTLRRKKPSATQVLMSKK